jgi:hypothetical protein
MRALLLLPLISVPAGCDYVPPLDPDAEVSGNAIFGEVVLLGPPAATTFVLLFDAADPPPPEGTGAPVGFAAIPADRFTGPAGGVQAAPYALTGVPDGAWLVRALVDLDGDFHPLRDDASGSTCGDWGGAHVGVDAGSGGLVPVPVEVEGGLIFDDVAVLVSQAQTFERPAFALDPATRTLPRAAGAGGLLRSVAVEADNLRLGPVQTGGVPCGVSFPLLLTLSIDDQGNPTVDYAASWPKIYLRLVEPAGDALAAGESWATQLGWDPTAALAAGLVPGAEAPFEVTELPVGLPPVAVHTVDGVDEVVPIEQAPAGVWAVTVINHLGQTWTVPNRSGASPATAGFDPAGQAAGLVLE